MFWSFQWVSSSYNFLLIFMFHTDNALSFRTTDLIMLRSESSGDSPVHPPSCQGQAYLAMRSYVLPQIPAFSSPSLWVPICQPSRRVCPPPLLFWDQSPPSLGKIEASFPSASLLTCFIDGILLLSQSTLWCLSALFYNQEIQDPCFLRPVLLQPFTALPQFLKAPWT